jgi:hypothetical protein
MTKGRIAARVCYAVACVLLTAAVWNAYRILEPAIRWKHTTARSDLTELRWKHDGEGLLVYYVYARLSYEAAGKRVVADAASDFATHDFPTARERMGKLAQSPSIPIYWNPSHPNEVRFALAYDDLAGATVVFPAMAAFVVAWLGWWLQKNWLPPTACERCAMTVKRYYRFCPYCRTALHHENAGMAS